ncbi:permease [Methylobacterium sp. Leaf399]|uniref:sulfite exporter TauE/SafE family protein n=1 Tax=unclassified Methylobacterium TaxID=2615210 RepID=UPI0006FE7049|nr:MULTISPECIES: sulfite exporter TauE/SafE family protein [unclassified Methylobacterium]KQP51826.1 permease [Methylobacterium sp. Leaf108]KQT14755.1 permease [Methylobacterium sp. Leaf399]KQT90421.1 permease [Methylobacterium sp. Leaf466]
MDPQTGIVMLGAAAGGFVQGLSGTSFGLVTMAVWAWSLDPVLTGPLVVFGSLIGQLLSLGAIRRSLDPKRLLPFVAGGILGVPIGVALLQVVDPRHFKLAIGILLAVWCPIMLFARDLPRIAWGGRIADSAVGVVGGIMGGLGGLTGPAPTLWATLRGWDRDTQRGVFQGFNLVMHAVTLTTYVAVDAVPAEAFALFPAVALAVLCPALVGARLYRRFSEETFRTVILSLLTASGFVLIATTLPTLR